MSNRPDTTFVPQWALLKSELSAISYSRLDEGKIYYLNNKKKWYIVRLTQRAEVNYAERLFELQTGRWKPVPKDQADIVFEDLDVGGDYVFYIRGSRSGGTRKGRRGLRKTRRNH